MIRIASLAVIALSISLALPASAMPIEITGRFLYQDRLYD